MGKLTVQAPPPLNLDEFGIVAVRGADAHRFLQGQVSQNIDKLRDGKLLLAGYHTPQGRVLAVLHLCAQGNDDVLMILPREITAGVATRLAKFLLRAKARVVDESLLWQLQGHREAAPNRYAWADRFVSIEPRSELAHNELPALPVTLRWRAQDIAAGLPQVYASSSELFVAQMLNLDVLEGIAFDKGCYTGQEIIARAHYRGRVKRRMQRFATADPRLLTPGERVLLADGRNALIVAAANASDGSQEFLAVASTGDSDDAADNAGTASANTLRLAASSLPLPYSLPL